MKRKDLIMIMLACLCLPAFAAGDFMNNENARLENFLGKIKRGEEVTVVALGGSITTGFNSTNPSKDGWAGLTGKWLKELAEENGAKLNYYNRGCSGTDSAFAIARLTNHVLSLKPDLLLLEFAMNDQWLETKVRERTYEAIIRQMLKNDTAILALFVNERKSPYPSAQFVQQPICEYYHIPFVSWKECIEAEENLDNFELYFDGEETVHPNNEGHKNISSHIQKKILSVWENIPKNPKPLKIEKKLPVPLTACDYENSKYYTSENLKPVKNTGWEIGCPLHNEWKEIGNCYEGWQTNNVDGEITFEVEGSSVGITYCESDQFRNAQAWVTLPDGSDSPKVNLMCMVSYRKGYYGWAYKELISGNDVQKYIVHVTVSKRAPKTAEGKYANITGILVGGAK